jgi:hypothetical protein
MDGNNDVAPNVIVTVAGLAPMNGLLVAPPLVVSVPIQTGANLDEVGPKVSSAYVALSGFDFTFFYVDPGFTKLGEIVVFNPGEPNEAIAIVGEDAFATIAEAVDAANISPGSDTILLSSTTHDLDVSTGTIFVSDDLELIGSGQAETLIQTVGGNPFAAFQAEFVNFLVRDLTFDGGSGLGVDLGSAFQFVDATGGLNNVTVQNVIDNSVPGINLGFGVVAFGAASNVVVGDSRFENIGREGVNFYEFATGAVFGSTFIGRTDTANVEFQYGVSVIEGSQNVQITGNTFTGYRGNTPGSAGIQVADDPANGFGEPATAVIVGNEITDSDVGIIVGQDDTQDASNAFIRFNSIAGNDFGVSNFTTNTIDALRNWWGSPAGPGKDGNNAVGPNVLVSESGLNPNDGILINPPPFPAQPAGPVSVPIQGGATFEDIATNVEQKYIEITGYDLISPVPTITKSTAAFSQTVNVTITFSEPVFDFTAGDIVIGGTATGGKVVDFNTSDNKVFTVTLGGFTSDGTVTVFVPAAAARDETGNRSVQAGPTQVGIRDATPPAAAIEPGTTTPAVPFAQTVKVTITFTEPVVGFTAGDIVIGGTAKGGSVQDFQVNGNQIFTVTLGGFTSDGTVTVFVPAGVATDAAGNPNLASGPVTVGTRDTTGPTIALTSPAGPLPRPFADQLTLTFTFSEPVIGFTDADIQITGKAADGTSIGGKVVSFNTTDNQVFTVVIGGFTQPGVVSVSVAAGAATDAAGNPSVALPTTVVMDGIRPTVAITSPDGPLPRPFANTLNVTFTFSEPVTGFTANDIVVAGTAGGKVIAFNAVSSTVYTATLGEFAQPGTVTVFVPAGAAADAAGNPNLEAGPVTVAQPVVGPTVTIAGIGGVQLPLPFNDPIAFEVIFSEAVTGFAANDVVITGNAGGQVIAIEPQDDRTFRVTIGNFVGRGNVFVTIPAGAVVSAATGEPNQASATTQVAFDDDVTGPTPTIGAVVGTLPVTFSDPLFFTVTFDEPVTGFTAAGIQLSGTATGGVVTAVTPNADNTVFTVRVEGFTQPGTVIVTIPAGAAQDLAGNASVQAGPTLVATPAERPTINVTSPQGDIPVTFTDSPLILTVTFSSVVTGFTADDIQINGTAVGGKVLSVTPGADGKTFTVELGGFTRRGSVVITIPDGAAVDAETGLPSVALTNLLVGQFAPPFSSGFAVGGGEGIPQPFYTVEFTEDKGFVVGKALAPFEPGFTGGVRVAVADVNGDGTLDIIVGSGPGRINEVIVYDGRDPSNILIRFNPFEPTFTGGVFVHGADLTGDGKAEIIVSPDVTGGPRVRILDGALASEGLVATVYDFFGIADPDFRGGARVGTGDLNGDGTPDVIVAAGFGGGPRIAIFDGKELVANREVRLVGDFFGFEPQLRNGTYVAGGDIDGDGLAEVIIGAGPGGGPRIRVLSGADLTRDNTETEVLNFFGGDPENRGGIRVAGRDLDGDGLTDIIAGAGEDGGSLVTVYLSSQTAPIDFSLFGDFNNGVFVG